MGQAKGPGEAAAVHERSAEGVPPFLGQSAFVSLDLQLIR